MKEFALQCGLSLCRLSIPNSLPADCHPLICLSAFCHHACPPFVTSKVWISDGTGITLVVNARLCMLKKNLPTILVILIALILIAGIVWVFDKRIEKIEMQQTDDR
ncbi:MAG TPA: hypothetical protein VFW07_03830 [Parafilimonas sp.]|nr:hypothetical protein [Parafilimonas sp.]